MNLLKILATVSGMTFISRVTGFLRDVICAYLFGAGKEMDAFTAAFRFPNMLRRFFAEGAFSQAFVPILSEYKNKHGDEATHLLLSKVATLLVLILVFFTALGIMAAPLLVYFFAAGFSAVPGKVALTADLLRIVFPYLLFISLVSLAAGVLNVYNRFAIPAITPVLLNVSMIAVAWLAGSYFVQPIYALAWGVFLGGIAQLALQLPSLIRLNMLPRWSMDRHHEGVRRVLKMMLPALLGVSVAQISLLLNSQYASFLGDGRMSWLYYADRLMEFPSGLLGAALGTILLPSLAKYHTENNSVQYSALLDWGLRLTFLLALPAAVALALLAGPLLATLFKHGAFSAADVLQTRPALVAYSLGLLGLIAVKILAPGFYAKQNVTTPVKIALLSLLVTQLLNIVFVIVLPLQHTGLALSISLAACLNAGLLYWQMRKQQIYVPQPGWGKFLLKLIIALTLLGLVLYLLAHSEVFWLQASLSERIIRLSFIVISGTVVYFAVLWLLGFRVRDFYRAAQ